MMCSCPHDGPNHFRAHILRGKHEQELDCHRSREARRRRGVREGRRPYDSWRYFRHPDRSARRGRGPDQSGHGIRPALQRSRRPREPVVDAHDLHALHQRIPDRAPLRHQAFPRADGGARRRVHAQRSGTLGLRPDECGLAPARDAPRPQPDAPDQRRRGGTRPVAADSHGGARRPACAFAAHSDLRHLLTRGSREMQSRLAAAGLLDIAHKLDRGERLDLSEGVRLFDTPDLLAVGWLANRERERRHGARTFYNYNIKLEATNVCVASCLFCSFARLKPGDPGAYTMTLEQTWDKLRQRAHQPLTEVHVVNGLHPDLPFSYYTDMLRGFKRIRPEIHLKCFTAVEIAFFADLYGKNDEQVLRELLEAGLDSLPGGGAEIFADRVRKKVCDDKCGADRYLSIHRLAHRLGMRTNVTMLYGHIETMEERVDHMLRARAQHVVDA